MKEIENLLKTTLNEVEKMLATKSVVGEPIVVDGVTIIPLSSMGFGFGAGGGSGKIGTEGPREGVGGGTGGAGGIKPVAVVVVSKDGVRVEPLKRGATTVLEKVGDAVAKAMDRRGEREEAKQEG